MDKSLSDNFNNIISYISPRIQMYLNKISDSIKESIQEIRIRVGRPIVIVTSKGSCFLTTNGKICYIYSSNCVIANENEIFDTINKMCGYSMHSHYEDILNGYITLPCGSRVGLCGTAVYEKDKVKSIKNIHSINIRVPRIVKGVSDSIFNSVLADGMKNLLIAGPPSSGKTTMLRDIAYQLSSGRMGKYHKIVVVDERKEIFPVDTSTENLGPNTDVLLGFPKGVGISMAIRTLSPDVIICDEIGSIDDVDELLFGLNCGVKFIFSAHASNINELRNKSVFAQMFNIQGIDEIVFLFGSEMPCKIKNIIDVNEGFNEVDYINNIDYFCSSFNELYKAN